MTLSEVSILVVDDVNAMRIMTKQVLSISGFKRITLAPDVPSAIAQLETTEFHMILCDWHMSPLNGLEFLVYLRTQERYRDILFIMVTAETTSAKVKNAIKMGVDDYLLKPFSQEQAQAKIYELLVRKKVLR